MGKVEESQTFSSSGSDSASSVQNVVNRRQYQSILGFRCVTVLILSSAVFLSGLFWLPPFLNRMDRVDPDPDTQFPGHDIVASFKLEKPVTLLQGNIVQLKTDISDEIFVPTTKVVIISLESSLLGPNVTEVIFAVDSNAKNSEISPASKSLIKAIFESLIINDTYLHLTMSLFGEPFLFDVLKFRGGFTVIPQQNVFLLQKKQIFFNFTLNFSINQIKGNFSELTSQLKSGLHLAQYENLYISLTNSQGSTVAPPTIVQSLVLLAIGNNPSTPRIKQLAQTITGSHARNLGLNNSVFGKVKQVRLSSVLQHSLHGTDVITPPASAPQPQGLHQRHHKYQNAPIHRIISPALSPVSNKISPSHEGSYSNCRIRHAGRFQGKNRCRPPFDFVPVSSPPSIFPRPSGPLPSVGFDRAWPPSNGKDDAVFHDNPPAVSPFPSSSSAGFTWECSVPLSLLALLLWQ